MQVHRAGQSLAGTGMSALAAGGNVDMGRYRREFSPEVRSRALMCAKYRCQRCGGREWLEIHHVGKPMDNSLFNAEVLCRDCHVAEHLRRRMRGWKRNRC